MRRRRFVASIATLLALASIGDAQVSKPRTLGFVSIRQASDRGSMSYADSEDGFQLEYPSYLECRQQLTFRDPPSPTMIALNVVVSSEDPKTYLEVLKNERGSFHREELNGAIWIVYRTSSGAIGYYIYHDHMAIDIEGVPSVVKKKITDNELRAIRQMASTMKFTRPSERMDYMLAALGVGDRFGKLTVQRVITRAAANGNKRKYWANPLGEVDLAGTLRLTGVLNNNQTMNSGPYYAISALDSASYSQLPQVGHAFDFARDGSFQIHLKNENFVADALRKPTPRDLATDSPITIDVDHLSEVFYPGGGAPIVTAKLVRIEP